ncbi:MAG: response regulator [Myxococcota bacterium]
MKKRILIVDDSTTIRTQLVGELSSDFECLAASNGQEGLQLAFDQSPDAMVVDLEMPVMDGLDLLRSIKGDERTKKIPVLVVTTVTAVDQVNECRSLGCAGFVLKPVQVDYLKVKLRQVLARAAAAG